MRCSTAAAAAAGTRRASCSSSAADRLAYEPPRLWPFRGVAASLGVLGVLGVSGVLSVPDWIHTLPEAGRFKLIIFID